MMLGPGKWANALRDAAAKEFAGQAVAGAEGQGDNKDAHRARLKQLESLCGNSITIAALLMHNWNYWHMRLIMRRLHLFAKEQCFNATQQKTPNQHLSTSVRLACGRGEVLLGDILAYVVCDKGELARLGVKATPVTAPEDSVLRKMKSLVRTQDWRQTPRQAALSASQDICSRSTTNSMSTRPTLGPSGLLACYMGLRTYQLSSGRHIETYGSTPVP